MKSCWYRTVKKFIYHGPQQFNLHQHSNCPSCFVFHEENIVTFFTSDHIWKKEKDNEPTHLTYHPQSFPFSFSLKWQNSYHTLNWNVSLTYQFIALSILSLKKFTPTKICFKYYLTCIANDISHISSTTVKQKLPNYWHHLIQTSLTICIYKFEKEINFGKMFDRPGQLLTSVFRLYYNIRIGFVVFCISLNNMERKLSAKWRNGRCRTYSIQSWLSIWSEIPL